MQSNCSWMSCLFLVTRLVNGSWLITYSWLFDVFGIILVIILLSGLRHNYSLRRQMIMPLYWTSPKLPIHTAGLSRLSRPLSILFHFYRGSTSLLGSFPLEDHAIVNERSNGWSWCWCSKSQALLHLVGYSSHHWSALWLPPRFLLIEPRVSSIALLPRLKVVFICRASRFFSTPPPLTREALICR